MHAASVSSVVGRARQHKNVKSRQKPRQTRRSTGREKRKPVRRAGHDVSARLMSLFYETRPPARRYNNRPDRVVPRKHRSRSGVSSYARPPLSPRPAIPSAFSPTPPRRLLHVHSERAFRAAVRRRWTRRINKTNRTTAVAVVLSDEYRKYLRSKVTDPFQIAFEMDPKRHLC